MEGRVRREYCWVYILSWAVVADVDTFSLSRRDSLKRHILSLHEIFRILFGHEKFDLLKPRQVQNEELGPLIVVCISLQLEAQRRGVEIRPGHDLAAVYPNIAASLIRS